MKKSEFISRVVNGLNALNKDTQISKRYILKVGEQTVIDFVSKHLSSGKLTKDLDLITHIECLPLEQDDVIKCDIAEFRRCKKLMKSSCKLPRLFSSDFGNSITSVYSIDELIELKPISLQQYRRNLDRRAVEGVNYYYVKDGYLYIPDSDVRRVGVELITINPEEFTLNGCGCYEEEEKCIDIYDTEFILPAKFTDNVIKTVIQEIAFKKQIPVDNNPNLNTNN